MERLAVLEVLDRDGRARLVHGIHGWPVTVGRGLDNDLVLDDPHVAARHFQLGATPVVGDGAGQEESPASPRIEMQVASQTINGVWLGRRHHGAGSTVPLDSGTEWTAGATRLRLRLAAAPVAMELRLQPPSARALAGVVLALLLLLGTAVLETYLDSDAQPFLGRALRQLLPLVLGIGVWALVWAVASKIFRHRMQYWRHVGVAAWALVLMLLFDYALAGLSFAWSQPWLYKIRPDVGWLLLAGAVCAHLRLVLSAGRQWRLTAAAIGVLTLGLLAAMLGLRHHDSGQWWEPLYGGTLGPPWLRMVEPVGIDQFVNETQGLQPVLQQRLRQAEAADFPEDEDEEWDDDGE
ncbi:FHA domain-containing protein [Corticibacter populi]|uniref:FHA domain-containing protein n=1 Tax=Corticibacter populi TaxID=1550736 RepID=A0A3M6QPI4_9BURK|nr:FHA domain-containing protein [Corticibacter populi]RMX04980.1 FHA domain-containing protein [Corticibacter populi]RZS33589.1 hypothetical protein EV687_1914 [Corticibacter populi]